MQKSAPVIGIIMNQRVLEGMPTYILATKYVKPIIDLAKATPVLLPPLGTKAPFDGWLSILDGLLLTGSPSDVHPMRYGHVIKNPDSYFDEDRDETVLNLINAALNIGMPLLGICRGFQEINVALGGSLHQSIHRHGDYTDHREVKSADLKESYGIRHGVTLVPEGKLMQLINQPTWQVNSLHDQGVDRLAAGLQIEAYAEDGLIEAFSLKDPKQFMLATQWHIEWNAALDKCSSAILQAFGLACTKYKAQK